ncbi:hypothetical protein ACMGE7_01985 [Macrococcus equi]
MNKYIINAMTKMQEEKSIVLLQLAASILGAIATAIASGKFTDEE